MQATTSLVLRSSLLSWIDIQLLDLRDGEADRWIQILGNIVRCLSHDVAERATLGSWRRSIIACLMAISALQGILPHLIHSFARLDPLLSKTLSFFSGGSLERLHTIARILNGMPSSIDSHATTSMLFRNIIEWLPRLERNISLSSESVHGVIMFQHQIASTTTQYAAAYDSSLAAWPPLWIWGKTVELLWEFILNGGDEANAEIWGALTSRLLVWNTISQESVAGEWARRETIKLLQTQ